jgi:hypothetical protein
MLHISSAGIVKFTTYLVYRMYEGLAQCVRLEESDMNADYVWEKSYKTAILETDDTKLPNCLQAAKAAIDKRLQEIQMSEGGTPQGGTPEELQAINDALAELNVLRGELETRQGASAA